MITSAANEVGLQAATEGRFAQAIEAFRAAIAIAPLEANFYVNLGIALFLDAGELANFTDIAEEAITAFQTALRLDPTLHETHAYLGACYGATRRYDLAFAHFSLTPDSFFVTHRRALYLFEQGRFSESLHYQDQAIALQPNNTMAHYNRAILLLCEGRLIEGWKEFDWRHQQDFSMTRWIKEQIPNAVRWDNEAIHDKHLLLTGEQGLGDIIQFARYIPQFVTQCRRLTVGVSNDLLELLQASYPAVEFSCNLTETFDFYTCFMDAGRHFALSDFDQVPPAPYLARPDSSAWQQRFSSLPGLKVGLVWSGRPGHSVDVRRSIPFALIADNLFHLPISFVSLQKHAIAREIKGENRVQAASASLRPDLAAYAVYDAAPWLTDWTETARVLLALDLVLCADTSVAHLAGALGTPVWLINRFDSCWRWGQTGSTTPWYPSMRIYRQPLAGDWASVLQQVHHDLGKLLDKNA